MEDLEYIALKTERKLDGQVNEFDKLRDRVLVVAGYGLALLTGVFSFWDNVKEPFTFILMGAFLLSIVTIGILIYAAFSNPINRGISTGLIEEILENQERSDMDFFLHEIAYNLESFNINKGMLTKLQYKLNFGLTAQTAVTILIGIAIYFNNI